MKKLLLFLGMIISVGAIGQKNIEGIWAGTLDVGMKLRLVFNIKKDTTGKYVATLDSPDQGAYGIPCSNVRTSGDSLEIELKAIQGKYQGVFISDTSISGSWSQGGGKFALSLVKMDEKPEVKRPQTPKPPFSYLVKEVEYNNEDKTVHLAGTLTYPRELDSFPTAILISGSGQQDRDETIFGHKPFAVIADHLTKLGFAVLRVDDRGTGKSTGEVENASSLDFANDVETSINYLKTLPMVKKDKIGLIGHSEGGLIATIVENRRCDIDFVVMLAGPGTRGDVLLADQVEAILISDGISKDAVAAFKPFYVNAMHTVIQAKDTVGLFNTLWSKYGHWKNKINESQRKEIGFTNDTAAVKILKGYAKAFSQPWLKYFLTTDPVPMIQKMNTKVLALNGSKDLQVLAPQNLEGIRKALKKSKSKNYTVKELPGLNHLFQTCNKCTFGEYGLIEETFSPIALKEMSNWLLENVLKTK